MFQTSILRKYFVNFSPEHSWSLACSNVIFISNLFFLYFLCVRLKYWNCLGAAIQTCFQKETFWEKGQGKFLKNIGKIFENLFREIYIYLVCKKGRKEMIFFLNFIVLMNLDNPLKNIFLCDSILLFLGSWNQQQVYLYCFSQ